MCALCHYTSRPWTHKLLNIQCVPWPTQENFLRTLERVAFFFLAPGFTDHWPSDYEFKVRTQRFMCWEAALPSEISMAQGNPA